MNNSDLSGANDSFVQFEADLGNDVDSATFLLGQRDAEYSLVHVGVELVAFLGHDAHETMLVENLQQTRLGHNEAVVHRLESIIGAAPQLVRVRVDDRQVKHIGNLEQVLAKALDAVELDIIDLFAHAVARVLRFGHCPKKLVFRFGQIPFALSQLLFQLFELFVQIRVRRCFCTVTLL